MNIKKYELIYEGLNLVVNSTWENYIETRVKVLEWKKKVKEVLS